MDKTKDTYTLFLSPPHESRTRYNQAWYRLTYTLLFLLISCYGVYGESIITQGNIHLSNQRIDDLVVLDGKVDIEDCIIDGRIYTLDSQVTITGDTIIFGIITINQGSLDLADLGNHAYFASEIVVLGGVLYLSEEAVPVINKRKIVYVPCGREEVKITLQPTSISEEVALATRSYLLFERPILQDIQAMMDEWNFERHGFTLIEQSSGFHEFDFAQNARLAHISIHPRFLMDARHLHWGTNSIHIHVIALVFQTSQLAEQFWYRLLQFPTRHLSASFISSFGDGAHWFFRIHNILGTYWIKDQWFIGVTFEFKDPSTSIQEANETRARLMQVFLGN